MHKIQSKNFKSKNIPLNEHEKFLGEISSKGFLMLLRSAKSEGEIGLLRKRHLVINSNSIHYIGKESNELETSDVIGVSLDDTIQYVNYQKRLHKIIENLTLKKALKNGISRRTFFYLKKKLKNKKQIKLKEKILKRFIFIGS